MGHQSSRSCMDLLGIPHGTTLQHITPTIKSRRHPYASINSFVTATAQLDQIWLLYDLHETLSLDPNKKETNKLINDLCRFFLSIFYWSLMWNLNRYGLHACCPQTMRNLATGYMRQIFACLAMCFDVQKSIIWSVIKLDEPIVQYGRVSRLRSLPSPCDSCRNPAESGGIKFGRQLCQIAILGTINSGGIETGMVPKIDQNRIRRNGIKSIKYVILQC